MLGRGGLIMLSFGRNAQLPKLDIQLPHKAGHLLLDISEIVILQLLAFGRLGAEKRPPRENQVLALAVEVFRNEKIDVYKRQALLYG